MLPVKDGFCVTWKESHVIVRPTGLEMLNDKLNDDGSTFHINHAIIDLEFANIDSLVNLRPFNTK